MSKGIFQRKIIQNVQLKFKIMRHSVQIYQDNIVTIKLHYTINRIIK